MLERFHAQYKTLGTDECWPWTGATDRDGYGVMDDGQHRQLRAHRVAYALAHGDPGPHCVLHTCDNPPCCNPAHLRAGTVADNNADKEAKRRHPHGGTHPLAKLTDNDIRSIRAEYQPRRVTAEQIAAKHGVSVHTIRDVLQRRRWRHIN